MGSQSSPEMLILLKISPEVKIQMALHPFLTRLYIVVVQMLCFIRVDFVWGVSSTDK